MAEFLCRSCGRRFPPGSLPGAPVCQSCRLPTVPIGPDAAPPAKRIEEALPPGRVPPGLDEPRIIPAAKGREAARRPPTSETRREPPRRPSGIPIHVLVPANLALLVVVGLVPSLLLFSRVQDLESQIRDREAVAGEKTEELAHSIGGRIEALEDWIRTRGPLSEDLQAEEVAMLEQASRAVLHIEQTRHVTEGPLNYTVKKTGSGFIYDMSGLALTNFHVIEGYSELEAFIYNGEAVKVRVLGTDPASDIALLQLADMERLKSTTGIAAASLGTSADLGFGRFVYALGSPKNLKFSAARGIVSNPRRYQPSLMLQTSGLNTGLFNNWIQTDAGINPGNSGGPLLDIRGDVVGVVARKMTEAENIGFAIPIDDVKTILPALRREGFVRRSTTGMLLGSHKPAPGSSEPAGAKVLAILQGSPADRAGVRSGDIVVEIAGIPLSAPADHDLPAVLQRLASIPFGEPARLRAYRGTGTVDLSITPRLREEIDDKFIYLEVLGCWVAPVDPSLRRLYSVDGGAGVWIGAMEAGSRLGAAGIQTGDLIVKAGGQEVTRVSEVLKLTQQVAARQANHLDIEAVRGGAVVSRTLQFHFVEDE